MWAKNVKKNIPDVIDCNYKNDDQILIVFGTSISDRTGHLMIVQVPTSPNVCFCTTCKKTKEAKYALKTSITFISLDLWLTTALTSVHSLTMFAVSCNSESIGHRLGMLLNLRSDCWKSGAEHYRRCYQCMEHGIPAFAQRADICLLYTSPSPRD